MKIKNNIRYNKKKINSKGFTLVELLATLAILSLVLTIVIYIALGVIDKTKDKSYQVTINNIEKYASNYVIENNNSVKWIKAYDTIEYQCIKIEELINKGYLHSDVLESEVAEGTKINADNMVYLEKNINSKTITQKILLVGELEEYYSTLCSGVVAIGNINFDIEPDGWSKTKTATIYYNLLNNKDSITNYRYSYEFNGNIVNKKFEKQSAVIDNIIIEENGTIHAYVQDNENETVISSDLKIKKIDNQAPIIKENYNKTTKVTKKVTIPFSISDDESGINYSKSNISLNNITVYIGEKQVDKSKLSLNKIDDNNYELEINDNTNSGELEIVISENNIFDNAGNGNITTTLKPNVTFLYTITYNLLYGLENKETTTAERMKYNVKDNVVTVTADENDGYGFINAKVYLEANKKYIFYADTDGEWPTDVEAFLMLNGEYKTYYHMESNENYTFTPIKTGEYHLRFDVNKKGETNKFYNIVISEKDSSKIIMPNEEIGEMPIPTRPGHIFIGWFDDSYSKYDTLKKYKDYPLYYYADKYSELYNKYEYDQSRLYDHYIEEGSASGKRISQYISNDTYNNTKDLVLYAGWKDGESTLTVNPNGGIYNNNSSNSIFNQEPNTIKSIASPTPPSGYNVTFDGNGGTASSTSITSTKSFSGWTLNGDGQYITANSLPSGWGFNSERKTENNETYDKFTYSSPGTAENSWFSFNYPTYTYTSGDEYEVRFELRINKLTGTRINLRHSAFSNEFGTSVGGKFIWFNSNSVSPEWQQISRKRTISGETLTFEEVERQISPRFEGYTDTLKNIPSEGDFDIKNLFIINKTKKIILQSNTNAYMFKEENGTLTANYTNNSITLPNATRTGYLLEGWYTDSSGGTKVGTAGDNYTPTNNVKLYAHWTPKPIEVYYHVNGGEVSNSSRYSANLDGWMLDNQGCRGYYCDIYYANTNKDVSNYNNSSYINIKRSGYTGASGHEWNTNADGTGVSLNQATSYTYTELKNLTSAYLREENNQYELWLYVNWTTTYVTRMVNTPSGLNCRTGPSTSYAIKQAYTCGSQMYGYPSDTTGWFYYPDGDCYLSDDYLSPNGAGCSTANNNNTSVTTFKTRLFCLPANFNYSYLCNTYFPEAIFMTTRPTYTDCSSMQYYENSSEQILFIYNCVVP